jgi:phosphate-selective porin OprO and OprP
MMERSYVDQTVPGKKLGAQVMGSPIKGITYAGSVFQNNDTELDISADGKSSMAGRATLNFAEIMGNKEMVMHVGLSGLNSNYAIGTASSSQTDTTYGTANGSITQRGTISSFRSAGRGLNNAFRGQVGGELCHTTVNSVSNNCFMCFRVPRHSRTESLWLRGYICDRPI